MSHNEQYNHDAGYQQYLDDANEPALNRRYVETLVRLREILHAPDRATLFDIGAGAGNFLALAEDYGFKVSGNEVSQPAIEACRERHQIELFHGDDLAAIAASFAGYDAVTLWCVIAHVDDPETLLRGVKALLRPGGVLFFSTPRYCLIDRLAFLILRLTGEKSRRVFDRRINQYHRRQYSHDGAEALLIRSGFTPLAIEPAIGYGLQMQAYLNSIGLPRFLSKPLGKILELSAGLGLLPRNILNIYARAG